MKEKERKGSWKGDKQNRDLMPGTRKLLSWQIVGYMGEIQDVMVLQSFCCGMRKGPFQWLEEDCYL